MISIHFLTSPNIIKNTKLIIMDVGIYCQKSFIPNPLIFHSPNPGVVIQAKKIHKEII